jgi:hypothetical protein
VIGSRMPFRQGAIAMQTATAQDRSQFDSGAQSPDVSLPRARVVNDIAFAWYAGTMRPFESLESLGAKWCLVNRLSANDFKKWMEGLTERAQSRPRADGRSWYDVEAEALAKAFGEPIAVARTVRSRLKIEASNFASDALQRDKTEGAFRFCRACLKDGFHSDLHEVPWLGHCFVHPEIELVSGVDSVVCGHPLKEPDSSLIARVRFLMQLWGGPRPAFPLPAAWMWRKESLESKSSRLAAGFIADVIEVTAQEREGVTNDGARRWPPLIWAGPMESIVPRVRYWLNRRPRWLKLVGSTGRAPLGMSLPRRVAKQVFSATSDEQFMALDRLGVIELRVNEVFEYDEWPEWRRLFDSIAQALVSGHRGCQAVYDDACRPLMPRSTWDDDAAQRTHRIARIPVAGRLACERVQLAAFWENLFDHIKPMMPLAGARADSRARALIQAQRAIFQSHKRAWRTRVDASDEAAIQAVLGFRVTMPHEDAPVLADAVLYEIVLAAAWAIDEIQAQQTVHRPGADDGIGFAELFRSLHPVVALNPRDGAIELNMTAYVPSKLPKWVSRSSPATDPAHLLIAAIDAERLAVILRQRR